MPTSRVSGNQIENTTNVTISDLSFDSADSGLILPKGNENQRPASPILGMIRFNTTEDRVEQYMANASNQQPGWKNVRSATASGGLDQYGLVLGNAGFIDSDIVIEGPGTGVYTFTTCFSVGPQMTINSGTSVTVSDGVKYEIVDTIELSDRAKVVGDNWQTVGNGDGLGDLEIIRGNARTISQNITVPYDPNNGDYAYEFAYSVGPQMTIASGYSVTISDGVTYEILT